MLVSSCSTSDTNIKPPTPSEKKRSEHFVEDLYAVTDFKKIKEFWDKKLKSSPVYKKFHDEFYSKEIQDAFNSFFTKPENHTFFHTYEKYGIPAAKYIKYFFKVILP